MTVSPPDGKGPLLPWKLLPWWLRLLRVMTFTAWSGEFACLAAMFILQYQVTASPVTPTGAYIHFVSYKGGAHYLANPLFEIWTMLDRAWAPFGVATALLMTSYILFEGRIKRRRWQIFLSEAANR